MNLMNMTQNSTKPAGSAFPSRLNFNESELRSLESAYNSTDLMADWLLGKLHALYPANAQAHRMTAQLIERLLQTNERHGGVPCPSRLQSVNHEVWLRLEAMLDRNAMEAMEALLVFDRLMLVRFDGERYLALHAWAARTLGVMLREQRGLRVGCPVMSGDLQPSYIQSYGGLR